MSDEEGAGEPVAADESESVDVAALYSLYRDLRLARGEGGAFDEQRDLAELFAAALKLSDAAFRRVGLDLAVAGGMSGDWQLSLRCIERLLALGDDRRELKLWQLRTFVELQRFAESLALSSAVGWEPAQMLHVNYLTGLAFEGLGMGEKARPRYEAVYRRNSLYRAVAQKLGK